MAKLFKRKPEAGDPAGEPGEVPPAKAADPSWKPVETDLFQIHPEIAELRYAALDGDWATVTDFLDRCTHETDRSWATGYLIEIPGLEKMLAKVLADDPGSLLAAALLGGRTVEQAWEIRGGGWAKDVKPAAWAGFREHLERAEAIFLDVLARDPANLEAGIFRLYSGRGTGAGIGEIMRRYERVAVHNPHSFEAQSSVLQSLCPKWGGTWAEAHTFARRCAKAAPGGSVNGALVADVHIEHWMFLEKGANKDNYFKHPEVRAEILRFAEYSVLHEDYEGHLGWASVHGAFAFCFAMGGDWLLAGEQFMRLDGCMSSYPWHYSRSPEYTYREFRVKSEYHLVGKSTQW